LEPIPSDEEKNSPIKIDKTKKVEEIEAERLEMAR